MIHSVTELGDRPSTENKSAQFRKMSGSLTVFPEAYHKRGAASLSAEDTRDRADQLHHHHLDS